MDSATIEFKGWAGLNSASASGNLVWQTLEPKGFEDNDIDVEITHSSIDGTDLHILRSGWYPAEYPVVAGHEFVGTVIRLGGKVTDLKVGDRVGIGGQSGSCLRADCKCCANGLEQHCAELVNTYNCRWPSGDKALGGWATHWRGDARFALKIPDTIPSSHAAPMMCAGVTAFSPLKHHGVGPGKRVGVVGIGGVGHFGLLFAKALGASHVCAISRSATKCEDALKLGADSFIATESEGWETQHANSLDVILSTVSSSGMPLEGYLSLLDIGGVFVQVGGPEDGMPALSALPFVLKRIQLTGSFLGSRADIQDMLELAARKQVHAWIEERPMKEINRALIDFEAGKPRYRIVLHN